MATVSARIVLTQTFRNTSQQPTARAKYVFPLPERSAVCAFELERADGRVIIGTVKEKEAAARTFEAAIAAGKTAGLIESVTDDSQLTCCTLAPYLTFRSQYLPYQWDRFLQHS